MRKLLLVAGAAFLVAAPAAAGGGWATAGLGPPPGGLGAGDTWNAQITILQHGQTPLVGVQPSVILKDGDGAVVATFPARPTGKPGVYAAKVKFPESGTWRYEVNDGFSRTHTFAPVEIGGSAGDSAGFSLPTWTWVIAAALLALATAFLLARRLRPAQAPVAQP